MSRPLRLLACALAMALVSAVFAPPSSAHVLLRPEQAAPGTFQLFTVLSPNESTSLQTGLRLTIPPAVVIDSIADTPGYGAQIVEDQTGRPVALSWQGGRTLPNHLALFRFSARVPSRPGTVTLTGVQTFADGSARTWRTARLEVGAVAAGESSDDDTALLPAAAGAVLGAAGLGVGIVAMRRARTA